MPAIPAKASEVIPAGSALGITRGMYRSAPLVTVGSVRRFSVGFAGPSALARSALGKLALCRRQVGPVGVVSVLLDLPPDVAEHVFGALDAEPFAYPAVGGHIGRGMRT